MKYTFILLLFFCISLNTSVSAQLSTVPGKVSFDTLTKGHLEGIIILGSEKDLNQDDWDWTDGIEIKGLNVPGPKKKLKEALESSLGKAFTITLANEVRSIIIDYFTKYAHPFLVVSVPPQDVTQGVLQVVVSEGKVGKIEFVKNRWFSNSMLERYVRVQPGQNINMNTILNDVAWMNQNPYRVTDVVFTPGKERDTTDIEFLTPDRFPLRPFIGTDNTGNSATGFERVFTGFEWGNAFNIDSLLSFNATFASDFRRFQGYTLDWHIPLPWRHFLVFFGGWALTKPATNFISSKGYSGQASFRYQIPIQPLYQKHILEVILGYDYKITNNNIEFEAAQSQLILAQRVNISQFLLALSWGVEHVTNKFALNTLFYWSPGQMYPHMTDEEYQALSPFATAKYFYTKITVSDLYHFPMDFIGHVRVKGQLATQNLLPSEQFGLGGYDSVRGYDEREISVDDAVLFNIEVRSPPFHIVKHFGFPNVKDELRYLVFFDAGIGGNVDTAPGFPGGGTQSEPPTEYLMSIGPGCRYVLTPYFSFRFDWGIKLHKTWLGNSQAGGNVNFGALMTY